MGDVFYDATLMEHYNIEDEEEHDEQEGQLLQLPHWDGQG
jgi:hypothetical protein